MGIRCNLRHWMADARMNTFTEVIRLTGLSRNTLVKLRDEAGLESVELSTFIAVCDAFGRPLSDLLEYIPDTDQGSEPAG